MITEQLPADRLEMINECLDGVTDLLMVDGDMIKRDKINVLLSFLLEEQRKSLKLVLAEKLN